MDEFEYRTVGLDQISSDGRKKSEELLNAFGEKGWELVAVTTPHASTWVAIGYLKRKKSGL